MTALAQESLFSTSWRFDPIDVPSRNGLAEVLPFFGRHSSNTTLSNEALPDWLSPTVPRIMQLLQLSDGWDNQGASAVRPDAAQFAITLLLGALQPKTPAPQIVPLANGGLQFEWHTNNIDLELEITRPNQSHVWFEDHNSGEEYDRPISADLTALREPIDRLTSRWLAREA